MTKRRQQYIEDWHMDLVVSWRKDEGLTLKQCVERLNSNWPDVNFTYKAVEQRYYSLPKHVREGRELTKSFAQVSVEEVGEIGILEILKAETFNRLKISSVKEDASNYRRDAELMLKVLRMKKDYANNESEEALAKEQESIFAIARAVEEDKPRETN